MSAGSRAAPRVEPSPPPGLARQDFRRIAARGFGDPNNAYAHTMAFFDGQLYVGTTRANLALLRHSLKELKVDVWPVDCPHPVYSPRFEREQARAEIWRFSPRRDSWKRVYRAPLVASSRGEPMSRELGYRGMVVFQGRSDPRPALYLTTWSRSRGQGPLVLRSEDGRRFEPVSRPGLASSPITSLRALVPFGGRLFMAPSSAKKGRPNEADRPEIYFTRDPRRGPWRRARVEGFGNPGNRTIFSLAVLEDRLYAGTLNNQGFEVWRTRAEGRPPFAWERVLERGAGRGALNQGVVAMQAFRGALYIGTGIQNGGYDQANRIGPAGAELLRVWPDGSWDLLVGDRRTPPGGRTEPLSGLGAGFGSLFNGYLWRLAVHQGWLYAGTMDWSTTLRWTKLEARPDRVRKLLEGVGIDAIVGNQGGFELWRSADGENWLPVDRRGFGNAFNYGARTMVSTPCGLFLGTANPFGPRILAPRGRAAGGPPGEGPGADDWVAVDNPEGGLEVWLGSRQHGAAPDARGQA